MGRRDLNTKINTKPIMFALLMCGFVGMFSETALNIAISNMMEIFEIAATTAQWLTTGFLMTLGILIPLSGLFLRKFTTRQLFMASLVCSILGTILGAISINFEMLMISRVLQAAGMGILLPLMFNTILVIYPPEKRGAAMGLVGLVVMFAPATSPTIAGLLIEYLTWHYIFWISLPFLVLGLAIGLKYLDNVTETSNPRIDTLSIILSTIGFGGIVFGFCWAGEGVGGWTNGTVLTSIFIGFLSLVFFSFRQFRLQEPLLNLRVFKYPMYVIGLLMILFCMMMIMTVLITLPILLQNGLNLSVFTAGLMLLPGSALNGLLSPLMGKIFDKFGPKWLVLSGLTLATVMLWLFSNLTAESSVITIVALHVGLMIGMSMIWMPSQTNGLNELPSDLYPHGTAVMNTLQQIAGAVGTALAISILTSSSENITHGGTTATKNFSETAQSMVIGFQNLFSYAVIVAIAALIIAFFIKRVVIKREDEVMRSLH